MHGDRKPLGVDRSEGAGAPRGRQLVSAEAGPVLGAQAVDSLEAIRVDAAVYLDYEVFLLPRLNSNDATCSPPLYIS